jgi:hypothetical protein
MPETSLHRSHARIGHLHRLAQDPRLGPTQQRVRRHLVLSQRAALKLRLTRAAQEIASPQAP